MDRLEERISFLLGIPDDERTRLLAFGSQRRLERRETLWREGEQGSEFHFVIEGRIKLVKEDAGGKETIVDIIGAGDLVCTAVVDYAPYCCRAQAMDRGTVLFTLLRRDLLAYVERSQAIAERFSLEATRRTRRMCRRVQELASGPVQRRIVKLIQRLAEDGAPEQGGTWIPAALSRQDIADLCGTTIETASRVMTRLAREGIVETRSGGFLVTSVESLQQLAS